MEENMDIFLAIKKLIDQGFTKKQAEGLVEFVNERNDEFATKMEICEIRLEFYKFLENILKPNFKEMKNELESIIKLNVLKILKWNISFFLIITVLIGAIILI